MLTSSVWILLDWNVGKSKAAADGTVPNGDFLSNLFEDPGLQSILEHYLKQGCTTLLSS